MASQKTRTLMPTPRTNLPIKELYYCPSCFEVYPELPQEKKCKACDSALRWYCAHCVITTRSQGKNEHLLSRKHRQHAPRESLKSFLQNQHNRNKFWQRLSPTTHTIASSTSPQSSPPQTSPQSSPRTSPSHSSPVSENESTTTSTTSTTSSSSSPSGSSSPFSSPEISSMFNITSIPNFESIDQQQLQSQYQYPPQYQQQQQPINSNNNPFIFAATNDIPQPTSFLSSEVNPVLPQDQANVVYNFLPANAAATHPALVVNKSLTWPLQYYYDLPFPDSQPSYFLRPHSHSFYGLQELNISPEQQQQIPQYFAPITQQPQTQPFTENAPQNTFSPSYSIPTFGIYASNAPSSSSTTTTFTEPQMTQQQFQQYQQQQQQPFSYPPSSFYQQ